MKNLLLLVFFSLSLAKLFAQSEVVEGGKHELSLNLLDIDMVINSENQESKILLGTGLLYSYQFSDLLFFQGGISSYETNVKDNCIFCFFNNRSGDGFYKNKEVRVGLTIEKPSNRALRCSWLLGSTIKYGRADYRAILEETVFTFDPVTFEPEERIVRTHRNKTTRYVAAGLDLGLKYYPNNHVFIAFVSNVSTVSEFDIDNQTNQKFNSSRVRGNVLELRTGIRF